MALKVHSSLSLDEASTIIDAALATGLQHEFRPLLIVVLDSGGNVVAMKVSMRANRRH